MTITQRRTQSGAGVFLNIVFAIFAVSVCSVANAADPLPSWNDGTAKEAILEFVTAVTDKSSKDYVEPAMPTTAIATSARWIKLSIRQQPMTGLLWI